MDFLAMIIQWLINLFKKKSSQTTTISSISETYIVPEWFKIAEKEIGVKEVANGDHPRIIEYHMTTSLKATNDSIPWCSSFVSFCLERAGVVSTRSAWARSYLNWGVALDNPRMGCIVVFKRGIDSGHVAFFVSEDQDSVLVLGGNQSNSVCIAEYSKDSLLGYRWPKGLATK